MVPLDLLLTLHNEEKQRELLHQFKADTSRLFLERSACDINDALTSILAVSELESPKTVPKIKKYIHRVNQSLQSLKVYQSAVRQKSLFNIMAVLSNLLNVLEEHLKEKIFIKRALGEMKANGEGDQSELEELILYFFIQMAESGRENKSEFTLTLTQKDQEAIVVIDVNNPLVYPEKALVNLRTRAGGFKNRIHLNAQSEATQLFIKIPLLFPSTSAASKPSINITFNRVTLKEPARTR